MFKKKFLHDNTIGLIPTNRYRRSDKHSQISIEWLLYCEREIGRQIIHADRSREFCLQEGHLVDVYLAPLSSSPLSNAGEPALIGKEIVFKSQGCYVHGCPRCFTHNRNVIKNKYDQTYAQAHESTVAKVTEMRRLVYDVREMWECDFARVKSQQPEIARYLATQARSVVPGEEIKYTDICSLDPYICQRGHYPTGHPRIYIGEECAALTGGQNNDLSLVEGWKGNCQVQSFTAS